MRYTQKKTDVTNYDIDKIRSVADVETVVESLGIETRRTGRNISILCPVHDDQHYGSCFLTKRGFYCHACGAHGDIFKLTSLVRNASFPEACEYVCSLYGDSDSFKNAADSKPTKRILSDDSLRLIGLLPREETKGIYSLVGFAKMESVDDEDAVDQRGRRLKYDWFPGDCDCYNDYVVVSACAQRYPLQSLLESDEEAYKQLILSKAAEAEDHYREMIEMAQNPAKFYSDQNPNLFVMAYHCHNTAQLYGLENWTEMLMEKIRRCQAIQKDVMQISEKVDRISKRPDLSERKRANVFGKLKNHGVSL